MVSPGTPSSAATVQKIPPLLLAVVATVALAALLLGPWSAATSPVVHEPAPRSLPTAAPSNSGVVRGSQRPAFSFPGTDNWTEQTWYGSTPQHTGGWTPLGEACVVNNTYMICVGGQNLYGNDVSNVYSVDLSLFGTVATYYNETTDYGATSGDTGTGGFGIEWPSCVTYHWYIYCVGGANSSSPYIVSKTFYAQILPNGSVGPWTETTDYGAASGTTGAGGVAAFQIQCVQSSGYVYCTGGSGSKTFYAPLSSSGIGAWTETTDYGATSGTTGSGGISLGSLSCVVNSTDMYCVGGSGSGGASSAVYYAPLSASGIGAWTETTDYGATSGATGKGGEPIYSTACINYDSWIVCVDGNNRTNAPTSAVYYAPLSSTGVGPWTNDTVPFAGSGGGRPLGVAQAIDGYNFECDEETEDEEDEDVCTGDFNLNTFVSGLKPADTVTTDLSEDEGIPGDTVYDSATIDPPDADRSGDLNYYYYPDDDCSGVGDFIDQVVVDGNDVPDSSDFTIPADAKDTVSFQAEYLGDDDDEPAISDCETYLITTTAYTPEIVTFLPYLSAGVGDTLFDGSFMSGLGPDATGDVSYNFYPNGDCSGVPDDAGSFPVNGNGWQEPSDPMTVPNSGETQVSFDADYSGDSENAPASSTCEPLDIDAYPFVPFLNTSLSNPTAVPGQSVFDTATLAKASPTATGNVTYYFYPQGNCTGQPVRVSVSSVSGNGPVNQSSTVTIPASSTGAVSFRAIYSGDDVDAPAASACENLPLKPAPPNVPALTTKLPAASASAGSSVQDIATLAGASATAGGTVTYTTFPAGNCGGAPQQLNTVNANGNGAVNPSTAVTVPSSGTTMISFRATYSGDANDAPAVSACENLAITTPAYKPTISTTLSVSSGYPGETVFDSATLSSAAPSAGGTVSYNYFDSANCGGTSTAIGTVNVAAGNPSTVPDSPNFGIPSSASGTVSFQAVYSGDTSDAPATSACEPLTLTAPPSYTPKITTSLNTTTATPGSAVHDSATLTGASPSVTGTVTYVYYPGPDGCAGTTQQVGQVQVSAGPPVSVPNSPAFTIPSGASGTVGFRATYSGDANDGQATSVCEELNITAPGSGSHGSTSTTSPSFFATPAGEATIGIGVVAIFVALIGFFVWRRHKRGVTLERPGASSGKTEEGPGAKEAEGAKETPPPPEETGTAAEGASASSTGGSGEAPPPPPDEAPK